MEHDQLRYLRITMTTRSLCVLAVWALASSAADMSARERELTKQQQERIRRRLEEDRDKYEKLLPVTIYGKVIDQDGNPVSNADVRISWEQAMWMIGEHAEHKEDWVKTDKNGFYLFTCSKPQSAFVYPHKEGYERLSLSPGNLIWNKTSEESPVIITLRKKGETTFLMKGENYDTIRVFAPNSQTNSVDVLWTREDGKKQSVRGVVFRH